MLVFLYIIFTYFIRENLLQFEKISSTDIKCVWSTRKEMAVQNYKPRPLVETDCIKAHDIKLPTTISKEDIFKTLIGAIPNSALAKHRQ